MNCIHYLNMIESAAIQTGAMMATNRIFVRLDFNANGYKPRQKSSEVNAGPFSKSTDHKTIHRLV